VDWQKAAGDVLFERRTVAGLTQRGLAEIAGVSQAEIGRIETHRSQPTLPILGRLLGVLGTDLVPTPADDVRPTIAVEVADDIRGAVDDPEPIKIVTVGEAHVTASDLALDQLFEIFNLGLG
jgi:transcriptional regulator with XRE-family HTH domain